MNTLSPIKKLKTSVVSLSKQQYRPATGLKLEKVNPHVSDSDTTKMLCKYCGGVCWK